ncbi:MAG TPA: flagellar assembly protein FliX [Caulobacteraceae bacterium]|jgi:hypothetical protein|nr:flagellar assembly protein FliX [Caulobacteraceae bacterium]
MKVTGPGTAAPVAGGGGAKRAAADGFALGPGGAESAHAAARSAAPSAPAGLEALMALQGAAEPLERRRRAVRRAGRLLDMLDEVKLALLDGRGPGHAIDRLRGAVAEARDGVDDPRLTGLLDEIETRAAVELAKQEVARAAA